MKTSKPTSIVLLLGALFLISALSFPVQAKSGPTGASHQSGNFDKPPTNTKKAKSTPPPKRTFTPRPANTATRAAATNPGTVVVTRIAGTAVSTLNGSPAASPTPNPLFSATPTALGMNTIVAQQTGTVYASYLTSTALAKVYSPTPTNIGAEKLTPTDSDPMALSVAMTTTPPAETSDVMIILPTVTVSPTVMQAHLNTTIEKSRSTRHTSGMYWLIGAGGFILLFLVYVLYREWKRPSAKAE